MVPDLRATPPPGKPPLPPPPLASVEHRSNQRSRAFGMPPIGFRPIGGSLGYATLRDISCSGVGIARGGPLDLPVGTRVQLHFHVPGSEERFYRPAQVRWSRFGGMNTYVGLRFETPLPATDPVLIAMGQSG